MASKLKATLMSSVFGDFPREWGRWGEDDDVGRVNLLDPVCVLAAAAEIVSGRRFSLALPLADPNGDPSMPGRAAAEHVMTHDAGHYADGRSRPGVGGIQYTEDRISFNCHGTTHMDALGHAFADGLLWNGHRADTTTGGLRHAGIAELAERAVVGRAVLVDIARSEGVSQLAMHRVITLQDILGALARQQTRLRAGDTLILRTGSLKTFYEHGPAAFYADFDEPGITYEPELLDFFIENDIAGLGTDTLANERPHSELLGADWPLHVLLQRNLGIVFHEGLWLEEWARDCAQDGRYAAFYVAAPLRIVGGSAAPMNPVAVK